MPTVLLVLKTIMIIVVMVIFPSNKKTWIKAEQTFQGLKQAILEPAKDHFIGEKPPKLEEIENNRTFISNL